MLCNAYEAGFEHVKFISYSGKYPNFCTNGELVLEINGVKHYFANAYHSCADEIHHEMFWSRTCLCDDAEWYIDCLALPKALLPYAAEIDRVFNDNVHNRCCGGCR